MGAEGHKFVGLYQRETRPETRTSAHYGTRRIFKDVDDRFGGDWPIPYAAADAAIHAVIQAHFASFDPPGAIHHGGLATLTMPGPCELDHVIRRVALRTKLKHGSVYPVAEMSSIKVPCRRRHRRHVTGQHDEPQKAEAGLAMR